MADPARVSILLPVRDAAGTLPAAIASLDAQTVEDREIVVIDDGSVDGSPGILRDWARRDARVHVHPTPPRGIAAALATGLERCRAPVVARMDADDVAHPERLAAQLAALEAAPSRVLVGCRVEVVGEPPGPGMLRYAEWLDGIRTPADVAREIYVECPIAHPTFCFRRAAVEELGGYRVGDFPEDYDLLLRIHHAGGTMANLDRVLLRWSDRPERASRTDPAYARPRFLDLKALYLARHLGDRPAIVWGAGGVGRYLSRALLREGASIESFVDIDRAKWGRRVRGRPVVPPEELAGGPRSALVIGAVGTLGARAEIRDALRGWQFPRRSRLRHGGLTRSVSPGPRARAPLARFPARPSGPRARSPRVLHGSGRCTLSDRPGRRSVPGPEDRAP